MKRFNIFFALCLAFLGTLIQSLSYGQLTVTERRDPSLIVKQLEGPGVKISNISIYYSPKASLKPIGYFTDTDKVTGLKKGLLLTTGAAGFAEGPNSTESKYQQNYDSKKDPDLSVYSDSLFDVCYVEFDIVTSSPKLSFNYVFASEEYEEWLNYSDIFAFFIKGPGISGNKNIGVIPGTNIPVRVGTINNTKNSGYYISNTSSTHNIQYDGFTVPLKAEADVIPCEVYHIKLVIADYGDDKWDSGVFIEEGSFTSQDIPDMSVTYDHPVYPFGIEGCNSAKVVVKRNPSMKNTSTLKYGLSLTGTATQGKDFLPLPDSVVIPQGEDSAVVKIDFISDGIREPEESLRFSLKGDCPIFPDLAHVDLAVNDVFPYHVTETRICNNATATLNPSPDSTKSYLWDMGQELSCTGCASPSVSPDTSGYYTYTVTDLLSGCTSHDSILLTVLHVTADFAMATEDCYTSMDIFFNNNSVNGTQYLWNFGDGTVSGEASPAHQYALSGQKGPMQYQVTLQVINDSPRCTREVTKTVSIEEPLFIPNLFTPGNDGKNDYFQIKGIGKQCWTLMIYNRWGTLVFQDHNYDNKFDGGDLPEGSYFYLLENGNKDREYKGWVYLVRTRK